MKPNQNRAAAVLERIAGAIAGGRTVDWPGLSSEFPDLRSRIDQLRKIQSLADSDRGRGSETSGHRNRPAGARALDADPPFQWGPLRALERIGHGSFGTVYRAFDPALQREVALKLQRTEGTPALDEGDAPDHLAEARRLARVRHPNVLTIHGVEIHEGRPGMWTDLLPGATLEQRILQRDPLPVEEVATIASDLCRALAAVHGAGIVHGDIKAANVMFEADGRAILMDFGAGAPLPTDSAHALPQATRRRGTGTPLVMAPEILEGNPPTVSSDLYALGVLLYRLATGRYPIEARTMRELLARHRKHAIIRLTEVRPDFPPESAEAIHRALSHDPASRFRDALEMGQVLAASVGRAPVAPRIEDQARRARAHNFPRVEERFIGRERELAAVRRQLMRHRLITLVGPGGSGKTRLALQAATDLLEAFPDGVFWTDLAPVGDELGVVLAVAQVLTVRQRPDRPLELDVQERLSDQSLLLVLDNCEHVPGACSRLASVVASGAPGVRILATSQVPLALPHELTIRVASLTLPPLRTRGNAAPGLEIAEAESVRLFVDRAHQSLQGFALTRSNAQAIATICRRLDGIPLAIELAAARVRVLPPEEIAARLEESMKILSSSEGGRVGRQKTLEASIDWSARLLSEEERILLRRLAVFSGRWTLEAAEAVCRDAGEEAPEIGGHLVLDLMERLVQKSLIHRDPGPVPSSLGGGSPEAGRPLNGYRMLEMVRLHAGARLADSGEIDAVQGRNTAYTLSAAREAVRRLNSADEAVWVRRLDWEHENFLILFRWIARHPEHGDDGMQAALALGRYWFSRGYFTLACSVLESLLTLPTLSAMHRGRGLASIATFVYGQGDRSRLRTACEEALELLRGVGDHLGISETLTTLGSYYMESGDPARGVELLDEAVAIRRGDGIPLTYLATSLCNLGVACAYAGDLARARAAYEEALRHLETTGDKRGASIVASNLAATALDLEDFEEASRWAAEALHRLRGVGEGLDSSNVLGVLAAVAREAGDARLSRSRELEAVKVRLERGDRRGLVRSIGGFACTIALEGDHERVARLFGAMEVHRETLGVGLDPGFAKRFARIVESTRKALGSDRYDDFHALGRTLTLEQSLSLAGADVAL